MTQKRVKQPLSKASWTRGKDCKNHSKPFLYSDLTSGSPKQLRMQLCTFHSSENSPHVTNC